MAKEILSIPEEHLKEVIRIIRQGLIHYYDGELPIEVLSYETVNMLRDWCDEESEYLEKNEKA